MRKGRRCAGVILPTILLASLSLAPQALAVPASVSLSSRVGPPTEVTLLVRTDWPQYKFDPQRDGYNPYENVLSPANVSQLTPVWVASKLPSYVKSSVAVAGGRVFLPVYTDFFAFDAATGHQDWDSYIDYEP